MLLDVLNPAAAPVDGDAGALIQLGHVYKQLDATVGAFGTAVVNADSRAVQTGTGPSDGAYLAFENQLNSLTNDRNRVALQISQLLDAASFDQTQFSTGAIVSLEGRAQSILDRAQQLASND